MDGIGITRRELRQAIGMSMGDFKQLVASKDGGDTILYDEEGIVGGRNRYRGSDLVVVSSAASVNDGKVRRVSNSYEMEGRLEFRPALPAPIVAGDVFHLVNLRGTGWTKEQYDQAIRDAVREGSPQSWDFDRLEVLWASATRLGEGSFRLTIPTNWVYFVGVQCQLDATLSGYVDTWVDLRPARRPGTHGWTVSPTTDGWYEVTLNGVPDVTAFALTGCIAARLPEHDSDEIRVDFRFCMESAKASLYEARARDSDDENDLNQAYAAKQAARDLHRGAMVNKRRTPGGAIRLRR